MTRQLVLPGMGGTEVVETFKYKQFTSIYFFMGSYNEDDGVPKLIGYDCPFDDSPTFIVNGEDSLVRLIRELYHGRSIDKRFREQMRHGMDFEGKMPDIIINGLGVIQDTLYDSVAEIIGARESKLVGKLSEGRYSNGRESLTSFWVREKERWGF